MNILLTSAGRRTYLVEYFKAAVGGSGKVYAANSQMSPALKAADRYFITPIIYSSDYIPFLLDICRKHDIDMLVSLFDIDMPVLAAHRDDFEAVGTRLAMSDADFYRICSDKHNMCLSLTEHGICSPKSYLSVEEAAEAVKAGKCDYPFIVKPRFGMGSIGVFKVYDGTELIGAYSMCRRESSNSYLRFESASVDADNAVLIQECISGEEYGMDVICDLDGNYVNTIIRKKFAMRSGETDEAVILGTGDDCYDVLTSLGEQFAKIYRPKGLTDMDVIMDRTKAYVRDINGRFGGGYPFSHAAGADVPKAYVLWAEGKKEEAAKYCKAKPKVHGYKDIVLRMYD